MRLRAVCSGKVFSRAVKKAWVWNGGLEYVGSLRNDVSTTYGAGTPEFKVLLKGGESFVREDRIVVDEFEGSRGWGEELEVVGGSPRLGPVL